MIIMAKVANLMAKHNGVSTAVASLYDEKISVIEDNSTLILAHFNENGVIDACGNDWTVVTDTYAMSSIINTENAKFDYAFHPAGNDVVYAQSTVDIDLGNKDFTAECWLYAEIISSAKCGYKIFSLFNKSNIEYPRINFSVVKNANVEYPWIQFQVRPNNKESLFFSYIYSEEKSLTNFFGNFNHIAVSYSLNDQKFYCFLNGKLLKTVIGVNNLAKYASVLKFDTARIGGANTHPSTGIGGVSCDEYSGAISEVVFRENFVYPLFQGHHKQVYH